jgi:hypothetical protein
MSYALGDLSDATPDKMRHWPEDKLLFVMRENRGGVYDNWARSELARRQNEQLSNLIMRLNDATGKVADEVRALASSSDRLEALTKKLNFLTIVLVVLTVVAVATPIGIEIYHANNADKKIAVPITGVTSPTKDSHGEQRSAAPTTPQPEKN